MLPPDRVWNKRQKVKLSWFLVTSFAKMRLELAAETTIFCWFWKLWIRFCVEDLGSDGCINVDQTHHFGCSYALWAGDPLFRTHMSTRNDWFGIVGIRKKDPTTKKIACFWNKKQCILFVKNSPKSKFHDNKIIEKLICCNTIWL